MIPTFLVIGLVLGVALYTRWTLLLGVAVGLSLALAVTTTLVEGSSLASGAGIFGLALANTAIGVAVGFGARGVFQRLSRSAPIGR